MDHETLRIVSARVNIDGILNRIIRDGGMGRPPGRTTLNVTGDDRVWEREGWGESG